MIRPIDSIQSQSTTSTVRNGIHTSATRRSNITVWLFSLFLIFLPPFVLATTLLVDVETNPPLPQVARVVADQTAVTLVLHETQARSSRVPTHQTGLVSPGAEEVAKKTYVPCALNAESAISKSNPNTLARERTGCLSVSRHNGVLSLTARNADFRAVLSALSASSGVPIKVIGDLDTSLPKISVTLDRVRLEEAVKQVIHQLPAGGYAMGPSRQNNRREIYVVAAKERQKLLAEYDRLVIGSNSGNLPEAKTVADWLVKLFSTYGAIDPAGTSSFVTPVLAMVNDNFAHYRDMVFSMLSDRLTPTAVRTAFLEIVGNHWSDPRSERTVAEIFMHPARENPVVLGRSAEALAARRVDIGNEIVERYELADPKTKFYYATALAHLDRKDAVPMLIRDIRAVKEPSVRASAIRAVGRLQPDDVLTAATLDQVIESASATKASPNARTRVEAEALAMQAIVSISRSNEPSAYRRLVAIAGNDSMPVDVRLTAIERLRGAPLALANELVEALSALGTRVSSTRSLDGTTKERFARIIKHASVALANRQTVPTMIGTPQVIRK